MTLQRLLLLASALFIVACAGTIQSTSLSEAYKKYELQEFERSLELITRAENIRQPTPEMKAELTYLKAQAHERLGHQKIARTLYEYISQEHKDSQYGYLADNKLSGNL